MALTAAAWVYYYSGLFALHLWWLRRRGQTVLILAGHRVLPAGSPVVREHLSLRSIIVTRENLQAAIRFLQRHFAFSGLAELARLEGGAASAGKMLCCLTFDDGYGDFGDHAWPALQTYGVPAVLFVPTALMGTSHSFWWDEVYYHGMKMTRAPDRGIPQDAAALIKQIAVTAPAERPRLIYRVIDLMQDWPWAEVQALCEALAAGAPGGSWRRYNKLLNWDEIKRLHGQGVEIGSHTRRHINVKNAPPAVLQEEIEVSKRELEAILQEPVMAFSFPGGHMCERAVQAVMQAGYVFSCGTRKGVNRPADGFFRLLRINLWDGMMQDFRGRFSPAVFALNLMRP